MNYQIVGGDGQDYGPVSGATVRQWIAEGRLDADSKIKAEGADTWSAVGAVAEFQTALVAQPASLSAPSGRIDIGECVSGAFRLFGVHWVMLVVASLILLVAMGVAWLASSLIQAPCSVVLQQAMHGESVAFSRWVVVAPLYFAGMALNGAVNAFLMAGWMRFLVRLIRGGAPDFNELFAGFRQRQLPIALTGIAQTLIVLAGTALCVIPGIYLGICYTFAAPLALDKGLGVWETLETGRRVITKQWFLMFALVLIAMAFALAGLLLCGIGLLAAMPVAGLMLARAYNDLFGEDSPA